MRIKISQGRVIDPANDLDSIMDVYIADGLIAAIDTAPDNFQIESEIDAKGKIVCPGLIDLCARMREPGQEQKATIASEAKAAVSGGITSICYPPDTNPIIDTPAVAELIHRRAQAAGLCKIYPVAAMTENLDGMTLSEMAALKEIGCVAVSNAYSPFNNTEVLRRAMEYAATCSMPIMLFCEDDHLRNNGTAHEGVMSMRLGLPGIPEIAETIAVSRALLLAEQCQVKIHFCRLSSARSVEFITDAKARGLQVTADVSIHHLHLTEKDLEGFNSNCHLRPPLRTESDRAALIKGIKDGVIESICSDHQPHDDDAKCAPYSLTEPGASSIELLFGLAMELAPSLDISTIIQALTLNPASILNLNAGRLSPGNAADVCIFDPDKDWVIDKSMLISAGKNIPYEGKKIKGRVAQTIMDGNIVFSA